MELIAHLYNNYAQISSTDMATNNKRLHTSYNAEKQIESFIERLDDCAYLATASRQTVSETQLLHFTYMLVAGTGKNPEY